MYLVFDTETNGKAFFDLAPEHEKQPRLVQLGAQLISKDWTVCQEINLLIKPVGFVIPPEAERVHGISTDLATAYGIDEKDGLTLFAKLLNKAEVLVAHNIQFDGIVMGRALHLHGINVTLPSVKRCTMKEMTPICNLKGPYGPKWPTLAEAYRHCYGEDFTNAHDALADVRACARVLRWLVEGGKPMENKSPVKAVVLEYDDLTPMPFGKYKNTPLQDVPADYFHWLWGQRPLQNAQLEAYIKRSLSALKQELPSRIWT